MAETDGKSLVYSGGVWKLVGVLNGNSNAVLKLIFPVDGNTTGVIVNKVVVKSNETGNGTNVSNNNTTLTNVSLGVTKVSDKSVVNVGENLTYTIVVTNSGSTAAHDVVEEIIPNGLTLINNSWDASKWTRVGNSWKFVGALGAGQNATLTLVFRVNGNSTGVVVNTVVVKSNA